MITRNRQADSPIEMFARLQLHTLFQGTLRGLLCS